MKQFYIIYVGDFNNSVHESPLDLTDEQFKDEAIRQNNVFTTEGLCASWNEDVLPVIDSYIRYI